ncbi:NADH-quinone oxidoreductase subunit K [Pontiella sulfatireligans]|uniref:NADH-quinone oxidoreductase subunit K n=1 Tax=Pontiella sulfatireligans TaxID=2750658 RepID=UPI00109BFFE6
MMKGLIFATILIGLLGLLFKRNLLLRVLSMDVMGTGVISLFVLYATRHGRRTPTVSEEAAVEPYADPVLQAVILTAIVIGFSIVALVLVQSMYIAKRYPTLEVDEIEEHWKEDG